MTSNNEPSVPNADLLKSYLMEAYQELGNKALALHEALARADTPEKQLTLSKLLTKHIKTIEDNRKRHGKAYTDSKKVIDVTFGSMSAVLESDQGKLREYLANHLKQIGGDNPEIRDEYNHLAKFRTVKAWRVTNIDKVPREFMTIDKDAIDEALAMELPIEGIEYYDKKELTIS